MSPCLLKHSLVIQHCEIRSLILLEILLPHQTCTGDTSVKFPLLTYTFFLAPSPMSPFQEIEECVFLLEKESVAFSPQLGPLRVLPLHVGLGRATQRIYEPEPEASVLGKTESSENQEDLKAPGSEPWVKRKVILTDTLGEASFSQPGIRYVIDTGLQLKTVSNSVRLNDM